MSLKKIVFAFIAVIDLIPFFAGFVAKICLTASVENLHRIVSNWEQTEVLVC